MNSNVQITTSFDKKQMDVCNMRCLTKNQFNFLTPLQINCFSQCTKTVSRGRFNSQSSVESLDNSPLFRKSSLRGPSTTD